MENGTRWGVPQNGQNCLLYTLYVLCYICYILIYIFYMLCYIFYILFYIYIYICLLHLIVFYIIGVRAGARTGYVIPGRDGNGGWRFEEILPPSSPSPSSPPPPPSTPQSMVLGRIYLKMSNMHFKKSGVSFWAKKESPCGHAEMFPSF